ncbi:hypothetical protein PanWU01x14_179620 [Parasponia andersonii]|uniref:Uncharacterized protein n=1 Tax=Parasponia andersonii TaxID=3476 RepID=A0A2P5C6X8_PARAD|nr:hypothetical protein PanWU01x14_179620 [Parasponia andersonii]
MYRKSTAISVENFWNKYGFSLTNLTSASKKRNRVKLLAGSCEGMDILCVLLPMQATTLHAIYTSLLAYNWASNTLAMKMRSRGSTHDWLIYYIFLYIRNFSFLLEHFSSPYYIYKRGRL